MDNYSLGTITGADMVVFFGFREIYLTNSGDGSDADKARRFIWFDAGTVTQIRFATQKPAAPKFTLQSLDPIGISDGISATQGDMIFKNFNEDSVEYILRKIKAEITKNYKLAGEINVDSDAGGYGSIQQGEYLDQILDDADVAGFWSDNIKNWSDMPMFDIMVISKSNDYDTTSEVSKLKIKNVKITDVGSADGIDSTEVNDIVKFICASGVESWKEYAPSSTVGGV